MTTAPNTGFGVNVRLRDRQCQPVVDTSDFVFVRTVDDPSIVELSTSLGEPTNAQLRGSAAGKTTLHVAAERRSNGVVVADATMNVAVTMAQGI